MSNSLDPDQARRFKTVCQSYQQTSLVDKELIIIKYATYLQQWALELKHSFINIGQNVINLNLLKGSQLYTCLSSITFNS